MGGRNMGGLPPQPHPVLLRPPREYLAMEDRMADNLREIHLLLKDHREMTATHETLVQDLSFTHQKLRDLSDTARKVKEETESRIKELYEHSLAVEDEFKGIDAITEERAHVVVQTQKLNESKNQLVDELKVINGELEKTKLDAGDLPPLKADLDTMRQELHKGRAAIEFEKKTRAANLEQYQAMEKHLKLMQGEIEKLRAELAHAEKRARAAAAASNPSPGYLGNYGSPNMVFGGGSYAAHYSMHQAGNSAESASPASYRHPAGERDKL